MPVWMQRVLLAYAALVSLAAVAGGSLDLGKGRSGRWFDIVPQREARRLVRSQTVKLSMLSGPA